MYDGTVRSHATNKAVCAAIPGASAATFKYEGDGYGAVEYLLSIGMGLYHHGFRSIRIWHYQTLWGQNFRPVACGIVGVHFSSPHADRTGTTGLGSAKNLCNKKQNRAEDF